MPGLPQVEGGFRCVVADPPWEFNNRGTRASADKHYPTMPAWEIMFLPVSQIVADDAHLWMWCTDTHLPYALSVMRTWGFEFKQTVEWLKVKNGKPQMGLGNYMRHAKEMVLFGTRGKAPVTHHDRLDWFWAPRTKHSRKPDEFFLLYPEYLSRPPGIELFARTARPGWASWGNEIVAVADEGTVADEEDTEVVVL